MKGIFVGIFCELVALTAPVVTLFYRKGWFLTPDDPVSPYGCGTTPGASREPFMEWIYERFGKFVGDWWWLGVRNRAYGLAYALKPDHFKQMQTYNDLRSTVTHKGPLRIIEIDGYREYMLDCRWFHIISGYRLRPIRDAIYFPAPYRPINMDARPILSIRSGAQDR